jgi:hypothetical protein
MTAVLTESPFTSETEGITFLELEITGKCNLACSHCYAESGPRGTHGTMTVDDWKRVVNLATYVKGAVSMNATLTVQGGSSASDPGSWTYYAGPVTEHAPSSCVEWGGTYKGSSWTSGWSRCG